MNWHEDAGLISLTQGQFAIVDATDFEWLSRWKWNAYWDCTTRSFYAQRNIRDASGKRGTISLHRQILGLEKGDSRQGDHINHNTLDNRRGNLRIASSRENQRNRGKRRDNSSGFKGVVRHRNGKWMSRIRIAERRIYLGVFDTPELAHAAYAAAAAQYHGEFARVA